jgi:serine/threonine-protein kinase
VLPFDCAAGDAYLAEGVREDLIDTLSTSSTLRVRPAGSVPAGSDPRAVGRAIQVDHVVVGSVRRAGDQLRISARLVGIADGFQIWANRRTCTEAEVLAVSDELAKGVATALSTRAETGEHPTDPRAVDLYLRGRHELRRFWGEHAITAADLLEQALAIAPTSVPITVAYAYACAQAYSKTGLASRLPRARIAITRALATGHGEAHLAAAIVEWSHGDVEQMARQLAIGLTRAPMSAPAHELAGRLLCEVSSIEEGKRHFATAIGLEPQRAPAISLELARMAAFDGDVATEQALISKLMLDADPAFVKIGQMAEARLALWRRDFARTLHAARDLPGIVNDVSSVLLLTIADHADGKPFDRDRWLAAAMQLMKNTMSVRARLISLQRGIEVAIVVDQPQQVLSGLRVANELGLVDINWFDRCPLFAAYRSDPRWLAERDQVAARAARVLAAYAP